jgi:hypothetical protein
MELDSTNVPPIVENKPNKLGDVKEYIRFILTFGVIQVLIFILLLIEAGILKLFHVNEITLYVSFLATELFALSYGAYSLVVDIFQTGFRAYDSVQENNSMNQAALLTQNTYILDRLGDISSKLDGTVITSFSGKDSIHVN